MTPEKANLNRLVTAIIRDITRVAVVQYYDLYVEQGNFLERSKILGLCNAIELAAYQIQGARYSRFSAEETFKEMHLAESVMLYLGSQIEEFMPYEEYLAYYWGNNLEDVEIRVGILSAFRECSELLAKDFLNSSYAEGLK